MNKENEIVPELRFPEFKDEWTIEYLGSLAKNLSYRRIPITSNKRKKGNIPYYGATGVIDYVEGYIFNEELLLISEDGANLLDRNYPIAYTISGKTWVNNHAHVLKFKNKSTETLVKQYINSKSIEEYLTGRAQPKLNKKNLERIIIPLSKNPIEQQKIANCIYSLDNIITAETEKLDLLKDHKKGILQKLFPAQGETQPQYRFPEFVNDGDWEDTILDEVCTFSKGKGLPKSAIIEEGKFPCIHYGQLFTEYNEVIRTIISYTDMINGVLSKKNDVLMPTSDVTPNGLAKASCIKFDNVILGGDILIIRPNQQKVFGEFLSRYIRHLEKEVLKFVSGSTVFHIYASSMKLLKIHLPRFEEQKKIANSLTSVDDLIETQENKIENLKAHKKGLLQQLFPNINKLQV